MVKGIAVDLAPRGITVPNGAGCHICVATVAPVHIVKNLKGPSLSSTIRAGATLTTRVLSSPPTCFSVEPAPILEVWVWRRWE
jgi:hypothetical protein